MFLVFDKKYVFTLNIDLYLWYLLGAKESTRLEVVEKNKTKLAMGGRIDMHHQALLSVEAYLVKHCR